MSTGSRERFLKWKMQVRPMDEPKICPQCGLEAISVYTVKDKRIYKHSRKHEGITKTIYHEVGRK